MLTYIIIAVFALLAVGVIHAIYQDKKEKVNIQKLIVFDFSQKQELNDFYINSFDRVSSEEYYNEELQALALLANITVFSQKRHYSINNYNNLSIEGQELALKLELITLEDNIYNFEVNTQSNTINLQKLQGQTIKSFRLTSQNSTSYIQKISLVK